MTRSSLSIPSLVNVPMLALICALPLRADEAAPATKPDSAATATKPDSAAAAANKPMYYVYDIGCRRSNSRKVGEYDNLREARDAAVKARPLGTRAWIATGNAEAAGASLPGCAEDQKLDGCTVYVVGRRCGQLTAHTKADSAKQAEELAKQLQSDGGQTQIVYHLK